MREILFRGKRVDNGLWVYGYYLTQPKYTCSYADPPSQEQIYYILDDTAISKPLHEIDPETVGQYIEMCDKNETKIFIGDVVKFGKYKFVVVSCVNKTGFYIYNSIFQPVLIEYELKEKLKVIGNIYDNPELQEVKE